MQISFIILFMIDLYKDNHVCACVCAFVNFLFKKTSPQKLLTGLLPNFIVVFLRQRLKSSLHRYRKIRPVERYRRSSASSCHSVSTAIIIRLMRQNAALCGNGLKVFSPPTYFSSLSQKGQLITRQMYGLDQIQKICRRHFKF